MAPAPSTTWRSDFPHYKDGDVLIVLSPSRQYQLHSPTLTNSSQYFKLLLTVQGPAPLSAKAHKNGVTVVYRLELDLASGDSTVGDFRVRELDERGRPVGAYTATDLDNAREPPPVYHDYDNLFRLLYHQKPRFDDRNIASLLRQVSGLSDIAEHLNCMHAVSNAMDNALANHGQVLYRSIAANPMAWGDLAYRIRSEIILREAVIHLVGQWRHLKHRPGFALMRPEVREMAKRKHKDLDELKRAIELRIMGHYPQHMQRPVNHNLAPGSKTIRGTGKSTRANAYSSDSFAWMALNLFRHWLGQHVCGDLNRHAVDGGYKFYTALRHGGDAYIDHAAVESFSKYFPLSAKGRNSFCTQLQILKEGIRSYVEVLVENKSMLDITKWKVKYLTCLNVKKEDMPWYVANDNPTPPVGPALPAGTDDRARERSSSIPPAPVENRNLKRRREVQAEVDDDVAPPSRRLRQSSSRQQAEAEAGVDEAHEDDGEEGFDVADARDEDYEDEQHQLRGRRHLGEVANLGRDADFERAYGRDENGELADVGRAMMETMGGYDAVDDEADG